jgi:hypothetical protein
MKTMSSARTRLIALSIILAVVAALFFFNETVKRHPRTPSSASVAAEKPLEGGSASAPIKVVAFYPLNAGHRFIADYLLKFAAEHPDQVHVTAYDMQSPEGMKQWQSSGLNCAGVLINGKTKYDIKRGDKTESVDFVKRMGVDWKQEDFEALVKQLSEANSK